MSHCVHCICVVFYFLYALDFCFTLFVSRVFFQFLIREVN